MNELMRHTLFDLLYFEKALKQVRSKRVEENS